MLDSATILDRTTPMASFTTFRYVPRRLAVRKLGTTDNAHEVTVELTSGAVRGVEVESGVENLRQERSERLLRNGRLEAV